jgi:hypothetical protein
MFSWLKKKPVEPELFTDEVWATVAARERAVVRACQAGPTLVLAFFDETLERLTKELTAAGCAPDATRVLERADRLAQVPPNAAVVIAERHPLAGFVRSLATRVRALSPTAHVVCWSALDDPLMLEFGGQQLSSLMEKLGLPPDEPIRHEMLSKSIANAAKKVEERIGAGASRLAPARSMAEWMKLNLPPR